MPGVPSSDSSRPSGVPNVEILVPCTMTSIFQHSDKTAKLGHVTAVTEDPSKNEEPGSLDKVTIGAVPSGPASLIETLSAVAEIGTRVQKRKPRKTLYIFPPYRLLTGPGRATCCKAPHRP